MVRNSFYSGLKLFDITNSVLYVKEIKLMNVVQNDQPFFIQADHCLIDILDVSVIDV